MRKKTPNLYKISEQLVTETIRAMHSAGIYGIVASDRDGYKLFSDTTHHLGRERFFQFWAYVIKNILAVSQFDADDFFKEIQKRLEEETDDYWAD